MFFVHLIRMYAVSWGSNESSLTDCKDLRMPHYSGGWAFSGSEIASGPVCFSRCSKMAMRLKQPVLSNYRLPYFHGESAFTSVKAKTITWCSPPGWLIFSLMEVAKPWFQINTVCLSICDRRVYWEPGTSALIRRKYELSNWLRIFN